MLAKELPESTPLVCLLYFLRETTYLEQLCQRAYFPTEQLSLGEQTLMFGILFLFTKEFITMQNPIVKEYDCQAYANLAEKNFYAGIETYDMLATPSYVNAMALMLAVS